MINNQIIKSFEHCHNNGDCKECLFNSEFPRCYNRLEREVIKLLHNQKAEIERYKGVVKILERYVKLANSETIKEFTEKLKEKSDYFYRDEDCVDFKIVTVEDIDNTAKEMEE